MSLIPKVRLVRRHSVHLVFVQWTVDGVTPQTPTLTFTLQRSPTGDGDWTEVASGLSDAYYAEDMSQAPDGANVLATRRALYYRVGIPGPDAGSDTVWSIPMDLTGSTIPQVTGHRQDGPLVRFEASQSPSPYGPFYENPSRHRELARVMDVRARAQLVYLGRFVGRRTAILKRRRFGQRCPTCWSDLARVAVMGKCSDCHGTGWLGGYHTPVITSVRVRDVPLQPQVLPGGRAASSVTEAALGPYPLLEQDDLLVDLESDDRWRVEAMDSRVLRDHTYKQRVTVELLPRTNAEYRVDIPEALEHVLVIEPHYR